MPDDIIITNLGPDLSAKPTYQPHELWDYVDKMGKAVNDIEKELENIRAVDRNGNTLLDNFRKLVRYRRFHLDNEIANLMNKGSDFTEIKKIIDNFIDDAHSHRDYLVRDYTEYLHNHEKVNEKIASVSNEIKSKHLDVLKLDNLDGLISSEDKKNPSKIEQKQQIKPIQQSTTPRFKVPQIRPKNKKDE